MSADDNSPTKPKEDPPERGASTNDLVIRDGFPALFLPNKEKKWWIDETDETMKLPRWPFWAHDSALQFTSTTSLVKDCHKVFTARTLDDNASYSAGTTYFLPALMKPRCALEGLVQLIFQQHAKMLPPEMYRSDQSGAEWWTLVLGGDDKDKGEKEKDGAAKAKKKDNDEDDEEEEEEDDVGWHYDADYGLEDQAPGLLLHPRVGTVTYLSNCGAPTVVTDCLTPKQGKVQHLDGKSLGKAWVSYPRIGKHVAFDGRLLHGAPSDIFPSLEALSNSHAVDVNGQEPPTKRQKVDESEEQQKEDKVQQPSQERITLLVNVWLNHCPLDAELLDDEVVEQMETPWDTTTTTKEDNTDASSASAKSSSKPFAWNKEAVMENEPKLKFAEIIPVPFQKTQAKPKKGEDEDDDDELEDEIVLCNHQVRVKYGATMEQYHAIAQALASEDEPASTSLAVQLGKNAISLHVGDPVPSESEDEGDGP